MVFVRLSGPVPQKESIYFK